MTKAITLSEKAVENEEGGPFGCIVVKDDRIVGRGYNRVTSDNDPTAHAEIIAIRDACKNLGTFHLEECEIYTSCEPCPMCMGAIYWAHPRAVYYANTRHDADRIGFGDSFIYDELVKPMQERSIPFLRIKISDAFEVFEHWDHKQDKISY